MCFRAPTKTCFRTPMSEIAEFIDVKSNTSREKTSDGLSSFTFPDFTIPFRNHSYVAPVRWLRVTLDQSGVWSATYKLENCQWRGGVQIVVSLLKQGKPVEEIKVDFPLACNMAVRVIGGAYPEGLIDVVDGIAVRVGGTGASVC